MDRSTEDSEASTPIRVVVVSASIGNGHDGVARELQRRLDTAGFATDYVDFVALCHGGALFKGAYRRQLTVVPRTWGWLLTALARSRMLRQLVVAVVTFASARQVHRAVGAAALVVTTYPLAAQVLGSLRRRARITAPVVTVLTDMSVHPLWIHDGVTSYFALHEVAAEQASVLGAADVRVTGPIVRPAFRPVRDAREQRIARTRFGLPQEAKLALVVAGAWGVGDVALAAADLAATGLVVPVVACGRNTELYADLTTSGSAIPIGWTDAMADLVRACDVVVQNAGGLSSVEAIACDVPVLTYRCLPGHGAANAAALVRAEWVPWLHDSGEIAQVLTAVLTRPHLAAIDPRDRLVGVDPAEQLAAMAKRAAA
jgi:UDP-N-acetylglucosamine:LPS N-acetylglucosamine transferase